MLSPAPEVVLRSEVGSSGNKVYPEMEDGKLLGRLSLRKFRTAMAEVN